VTAGALAYASRAYNGDKEGLSLTGSAVAVSNSWSKFLAARGRASDIDYGLLVPLVLHSAIIQTIYAIVRVTTSYRAIELQLPVVSLGIISATFAIPPMLLAVWVGRILDRGHDAQAAWIGSGIFVVACAGFYFLANSLTALLLLTALFGVGHLFLMASQQMLCVRSAGPRGRDAAFGNYVVSSAVGQGLGPYIIAWIGGSATLPATGSLFGIAFIIALISLATAAAIRPAPKHLLPAKDGAVVPLRTLLRQSGLMAVLIASVITITSQDLLTIYLPLLGADQNIDSGNIGGLLTVRSVASLISRLSYTRVLRLIERQKLTLITMAGAGLGFACFALPIPLAVMYAAMIFLGFALGIATTLSLTNVVDLASAAAMGTVMSLRITGNRLGQAAVPFLASLVAAATGVGGIFAIIALSLTASGASVHFSRQDRA
jgi:predicted MFS family arabinose efflux permease